MRARTSRCRWSDRYSHECFTGAYRSTGKQAEAEVVGDGVEVHTTAALGYHEGLTIAVALDKGFVHEPTMIDQAVLLYGATGR